MQPLPSKAALKKSNLNASSAYALYSLFITVVLFAMKRPPIAPSEHEALYEYYKSRLPNLQLAQFGHFALSQGIKPRVSWEGGLQEQVAEHVQAGKPLLIFSKHIKMFDVVLPAVFVQQDQSLHPLIGNSRILAHAGIFKNPASRRLFDGLGAIPVFRTSAIDAFGGQQISGVTQSLYDATTACLMKNQTVVGFPEGGLQPNHPEVVGELGKSMVRLATEGEHTGNTLSLAMGLAYAGPSSLRVPQPAIHIAPIDPLDGVPVAQASEVIRDQMKHAVLSAQVSLSTEGSLQR